LFDLASPADINQFLAMSKCILIIEADPDILDIMGYILEAEGHDIILYRECRPIAELAVVLPDLILMDYYFSNELALGFCLDLKTNRDTAFIPVIILSTNPRLEQMALESRADGFLRPFAIEELTAISKLWLNH
jgi:DNA-binding response OmpR family regulator